MTIIYIILIYLLGCILAYGRLYASFYEIDEEYLPTFKPEGMPTEIVLSILLSWITFIAGAIIFETNNEKYMFKWSNKDLWKRYNEKNKQTHS